MTDIREVASALRNLYVPARPIVGVGVDDNAFVVAKRRSSKAKSGAATATSEFIKFLVRQGCLSGTHDRDGTGDALLGGGGAVNRIGRMLHSGVHPLRPRGLGHYFIDSVPSPFVVTILFVLASVAVSRVTRRRWRYAEDRNGEDGNNEDRNV